MTEKLMSARQVANVLQIHYRKVHRLAKAGRIPCIKLGVEYRFSRPQLEEWIFEQVKSSLPQK